MNNIHTTLKALLNKSSLYAARNFHLKAWLLLLKRRSHQESPLRDFPFTSRNVSGINENKTTNIQHQWHLTNLGNDETSTISNIQDEIHHHDHNKRENGRIQDLICCGSASVAQLSEDVPLLHLNRDWSLVLRPTHQPHLCTSQHIFL